MFNKCLEVYKIITLPTIHLSKPNAMPRGNNYRSRIFGHFPAGRDTMSYQQMLQYAESLGLFHIDDLKTQEHSCDSACIDANNRRSQERCP